MDPVMVVLVPGFLGGLVFALIAIRRPRKFDSRARPDVFVEGRLSTDVINMARIRVAGVGGLGLVAMAVVVALFVPEIRRPVTAGLVLGALFGSILILRRRKAGPMASSGQRPGANTMLSIDVTEPSSDNHDPGSSNVQLQSLEEPSYGALRG